MFRARADAELTAKIYSRVPVLIDDSKGADGNPWGVSFMSMFHMSNDSGLFRTATQLEAAGYAREGTDWVAAGDDPREPSRYVPLYEAKMLHHYDHRFGDASALIERPVNTSWPRPELRELADPSFEPTPWYWTSASEVKERIKSKGWSTEWLVGWRRNARGGDERTLIAAALPLGGVGDNIFLLHSPVSADLRLCMLGALSSLVLDFACRQKVSGSNMSYYFMEQFPVLPPDFYAESHLAFIVPRVLELTYASRAMMPLARNLNYHGPPFNWNDDRRAQLRAELDAFYARAYGLTRDELRYILDPADAKGADYPSETFRVLRDNEKKKYGEYRTARLVLQAFDELTATEKAA